MLNRSSLFPQEELKWVILHLWEGKPPLPLRLNICLLPIHSDFYSRVFSSLPHVSVSPGLMSDMRSKQVHSSPRLEEENVANPEARSLNPPWHEMCVRHRQDEEGKAREPSFSRRV